MQQAVTCRTAVHLLDLGTISRAACDIASRHIASCRYCRSDVPGQMSANDIYDVACVLCRYSAAMFAPSLVNIAVAVKF